MRVAVDHDIRWNREKSEALLCRKRAELRAGTPERGAYQELEEHKGYNIKMQTLLFNERNAFVI